MDLMSEDLRPYLRAIENNQLNAKDAQLKMKEENGIEMYFACHNLVLDEHVQVLLVGICPGQKQAQKAIDLYHETGSLEAAKKGARFVGQTRKNLLGMLDALDLQSDLHADAAKLFEDLHSGLDSIALIPFPVYIRGKNYSGSSPDMLKNALLFHEIETRFLPVVDQLKDLRVLIPLGKAVDTVLGTLQKQGRISKDITILHHFPHPSGLNTRGPAQFALYKDEMKTQLLETLQ